MNYREAQEYLNSFVDYEKIPHFDYSDLKPGRMRELLERLGNPQEGLRAVHVAGTKGKGSTCAMIYSILKEAGYCVGLYVSPHLVHFRERIRFARTVEMEGIRERLIGEEEICGLLEEIRPHQREIPGLTFFEIYTALALLFFSRLNPDFVVMETGLGGRLDATNVVHPLVCGITNISYDHVHILGKSLEKIAREKAGIIKENALVVSAPQSAEVWKVITETCREKKARFYEVGRDFTYDIIGQNTEASIFDFRGIFGNYENLQLKLLGVHQLVNAAAALGIIQLLRLYDIVISLFAVQKGLGNLHWPGRFQIVHKRPYLILDGAQNAASAQALKSAVNTLFPSRRIVLILGVSQDKDIQGICEKICRQPAMIIVTRADNPRAMETEELLKIVSRYNRNVKSETTLARALALAFEDIREDDLIIVTGSFYLVGEALKAARTISFPRF